VNDAAIAPFAIPNTMPTTASDAGTIMMPKRFHRVRPCTWPFWESAIDLSFASDAAVTMTAAVGAGRAKGDSRNAMHQRAGNGAGRCSRK
jgi:hypothetical protein